MGTMLTFSGVSVIMRASVNEKVGLKLGLVSWGRFFLGFKTCLACAMEPLALRHAVKETQVVKPKALKVGAVAVVKPDFLLWQVQAGQ
jgi:hypothetical protein